MREYYLKTTQLGNIFMAAVYAIDIILQLIFCSLLFWPEYLEPSNMFFDIFYYSTGAMLIGLDTVLLFARIRNKDPFSRMYLLVSYCVIQAIVIGVDIVYFSTCGHFLLDGYVWIGLEILMILIYAHRYLLLDITRKCLRGEMQ